MAVGPGLLRTLTPPVGGWDTRSAIADMAADNAIKLDNWFPRATDVVMRRGSQQHSSGMPGAVDTLLRYSPPAGAQVLFGASGSGIYNVTGVGAVGAPVVSGLTNARWQSTQVTNSGGHFLFACNGSDPAQLYNGTAWSAAAITGLSTSSIVWCNLHQRRLWFGASGSLKAWYLAADAIAGAAIGYDLGPLCRLGGHLVGMVSWSRDGGAGPQDLAVFLTSEGEVLVFTGTDPAAAATWAFVGKFEIGRPVGRRCFVRAASDVVIITQDGFQPISMMLPVDRVQAEKASLSAQIDPTVRQAVRDWGSNFGWEILLYPRGSMMICNVPANGGAQQYVFNTVTTKPCRFTGLGARCWGLLNDEAYFGTADGRVVRFDVGSSDEGRDIPAEALQAFNYFGSAGIMKAFKRAEPVFEAGAAPRVAVDLALDFNTMAPPPIILDPPAPTAGIWDVSRWGEGRWGGQAIWRGWRGVRGRGRSAAVRLRATSREATPAWLATNILFTPEGRL
ncbi:hypothetical protein [Roseococcus pinisoli]|uniref:Uncharacterized protein n=1 Tax=Roseococcus pinisoli TaxID=2835040 RepID=A0ABS5QCR0_9PROT|nr:hypothetical protein [Roseococcus pinisoli]MBS7811208.1 hypothetical protein [Roseococcus pinisoli]